MILGDGGSAMVLRCGDKVGALSDKSDPFEAIDRLVRESFRADIEAVVLASNDARKSAGGKPFDALLMFRMLVLQSLYNLSYE